MLGFVHVPLVDRVASNHRSTHSSNVMLRDTLARPDQLVVVVVMLTERPALVVRVKGDVVEKQNLQRGAGLRQAIEGDFAGRRFCSLGSRWSPGALSGDGARADVAEGSSERRANRAEPLSGTVDRVR